MLRQCEPSSQCSIDDSDRGVSNGTYHPHPDAAPPVNRLGEDRPAWLAALNLTAARHFLESDPPRLTGSRASLLRLANSLERNCVESDRIVAPSLGADLAVRSGFALRAVVRRAEALAAELGQIINRGAHDAAAPPNGHAGLTAVRNSIQDLDRSIAMMLGDRCYAASPPSR